MAETAEITAEIVSIGTELLLGEITDTNASWLAGRLPALGIPLYRIQEVGDNQARLVATLREAWRRADLLILTGGLGPTEDDVTREAIAELCGESMHVVPELAEELRAFFARRGRTMPERNVKQATLIPSASVLKNPIGTAPGWWVAHQGRYLAAMPGVPVEMRQMWQNEVVPHLETLPHGGAIVSRTLKLLGLGESAVEERLGDLVHSTNPTIATYAKDDGIHVRIAARAAAVSDAWARIDAYEANIRALFGDIVYGVDQDDLQASVRSLLANRGVRIVVSEAGLEGALCRALTGDAFIGGMVEPPPALGVQPVDVESWTVLLAQRAREIYAAPVALAATVLPTGNQRFRITVCLLEDTAQHVSSEEHRTAQADAPRRAVLLAMQIARQRFLGGP
jgi:nicotinamide-nucleotide amidase